MSRLNDYINLLRNPGTQTIRARELTPAGWSAEEKFVCRARVDGDDAQDDLNGQEPWIAEAIITWAYELDNAAHPHMLNLITGKEKIVRLRDVDTACGWPGDGNDWVLYFEERQTFVSLRSSLFHRGLS